MTIRLNLKLPSVVLLSVFIMNVVVSSKYLVPFHVGHVPCVADGADDLHAPQDLLINV